MRGLIFSVGCLALSIGAFNPVSAASVSTKVQYDQTGPGGISSVVRTDEVIGPATDSLVTPSGHGSAYAEIGTLRVGAWDAPIGFAPHTVTGTRTEATALWQDFITLTAPGAGSGIATFVLTLSATTMSAGVWPNAGVASTDSVVAINGVNYLDVASVRGFPGIADSVSVFHHGSGTVTTNSGNQVSGSYLVSVPFVSGVGFALRVQSLCSAYSRPLNYVGSGGADCDMTHTTRWAGLSGIVDSHGGSIVHAFTAVSQSGFDYITAPSGVPEPASWTTLILGFGLAGTGMRRRRMQTLR